ncbi:His-Xaa-Ser system radical SAM maturase HxsC [Serratia fonticola]|jgi:His-Xaa-Ser system radical SAM maturase HxsC|uniref:His-Xaa-Ser system radical SAM maturase HxsC n=1 Tax=Serratia fonticola TaxID=47917 RepID=UPI0021792569|nr:His-Xaa-Ser system radical SAM maturase HxsC [Serratia fonticola]CAI1606388.1 Molybdenum cofactor biosynthesis protein A [Serratia fonticola]
MPEVIRNDIFSYQSEGMVMPGFYRLCKAKPENPQFYLPNLLVTTESLAGQHEPFYSACITNKNLFQSIENGDIAIVNNGNMLRVILSRKANHNTVLVTERCNNQCLFCSQPPKRVNDDWLLTQSALAIAAFNHDGVIGISGGEPLLYGDEFLAFLDFIIENAPETSLHVLTNGRKLSDSHFAKQIKQRCESLNITFGIPLYSSRQGVHDHLVGSRGAFDETVRGLINAGNLGVNIELRFIPTKSNYRDLPHVVEYVGCVFSSINQFSIMGLESVGWARSNWNGLFTSPEVYSSYLKESVETASRSGLNVVIFNYPLCHLPSELWHYAVQSISDWKNFYPQECEACSKKSLCAGYFSSSKGRFHQLPRPI